ncbi:iron chelate uptake ABC transporter family permease subunit [uncultured Tessaracoccus sp.]|uniref:FecCD family ABC transporter permease n=1 Tax=uncultured Tessaracoccus sp. TaxID=905023 RepID=UPI0025E8C7B0|nr:iron chelate uptake ABC transporter family permease subunit [uncultured Tessaracoccus sp.]
MTVTWQIGPATCTVRPRSVVAWLGLLGAIVLTALATLTAGPLGIPLADLPSALTGDARGATAFVLGRLRGPRLATALLAGFLFGISGSLFQTVTRNPLGSPDVIGLGPGAGAGAALCSLAVPTVPSVVGAVLGAACATLAVFVATGTGFRSPARTILAGIGVAALANACTEYLVSTRFRDGAAQMAQYLTGSLNARSMVDVAVASASLAVLLPAALLVGPAVSLLELGADQVSSLGTSPDRVRTVAVVIAVLAAGTAVAVTGPIAFVALTAPQIARRLTRQPGVGVLGAGLTGALVLSTADLAAQQAPLVADLPVGVLTLAVGGLYLGWLLVRERREGNP